MNVSKDMILVPLGAPVLGFLPDTPSQMRFLEFFTANIRNPNTRKAYARAAGDFLTWCADRGVTIPSIIDNVAISI